MTRNLISFAAATIAAGTVLTACGTAEEAATQNRAAAESEARPAVKQLPPAIQASRTYRCADNSLVFVDFYTDNSAQIRTSQDGTPTRLTAEGGNPPFTAEGYSVGANAARTSITVPGKSAQSCRAAAA